ncbi:MAG: S49 family peptidase [Gammaproteobacteria bacterium]|nr:S49 family peptidase [Gammaproteobacteria bacterium]MCP5198369.1 S49 family peptidase [Gammaproteobacteria bacterium]
MGWDKPEPPIDGGREPTPPDTEFERRLVERMSFEFLREQRRTRRWNTFFKFLALAYVTILLLISLPSSTLFESFGEDGITALVDLQGVIAHDSTASADTIVSGLRAAFEDEATRGVILRINSPGGSPVQAGYINDEIYRLRAEYPDIPLYAVIEDICASGGYYVAAAADRIYADKASLVGSIGVRMDGFGFVETLDKLGIERRLLTAGENKAFLDPFSPLKPEQVAHVHKLLDEMHQQFINTVLKGRRDKLADDPELFSGLFWSGERSLALGLVDELGSAGYVAREVIKAEKIVDFTPHDYSLEGLLKRSGASVLEDFVARSRLGW